MKTLSLSSQSETTRRMQSHARFARKMEHAFLLAFDALVASWGSSIDSAATRLVWAKFGVSKTVITFLVLHFWGALEKSFRNMRLLIFRRACRSRMMGREILENRSKVSRVRYVSVWKFGVKESKNRWTNQSINQSAAPSRSDKV